MKNRLKKIIALLTALVILTTLLPLGAFAEEPDGEPAAIAEEDTDQALPGEETSEPVPEPEEEAVIASGEGTEPAPDEENFIASETDPVAQGPAGSLTWTLSHEGVLTITGTGAIPDYDPSYDNRAPWRDYAGNIKSAVLGEGVSRIGTWAFVYCSSMESITLPSTLRSVGQAAFYGCYDLKRVDSPSLEDWLQAGFELYGGDTTTPLCNGAALYLGGQLLTSLDIPYEVLRIPYLAFAYRTSLEEITFHSDTIKIRQDAFKGCANLQRVYFAGPESYGMSLRDDIEYGEYGNEALLRAEWSFWEDLTANDPVQSYVILRVGETYDLKLELSDDHYSTWVWWSGDCPDSILTVDENGTVTARGAGTGIVTASIYGDDKAFTAKFRIDVIDAAP